MQSEVSAPPRVNGGFLVFVAVVCAAIFAVNYARYGFAQDTFLWTIRTVVKQAFLFFTLSYIASPLHQWFPTRVSAFLMRHRATTGAAFAVSQLTAGACATTIWLNWPEIIHAISQPVERVLGVMVFVWIFIMLITSHRAAIDLLGRRLWSGIHTYGMIVIWIAYLLDYGRRTIEWSPYYGIFTGALLVILLLRGGLLLRRIVAPSSPARL
ncbi:hypothetical protein [Variovorax sp. OV700]|uniref:hypothetical protein n=1 Tax=Variovorax sp. OV700 TaxID=1882826 RepID=UPI0008827495|nr:hypothetical protein [Variovorax sp. OV700]SDH56362.1 hypothetical protein SAMN05444748_101710 [Variovorax sp. OV700]